MLCPQCKLGLHFLATLVNKDKTLSDYYYCLNCHQEFSENIKRVYDKLDLKEFSLYPYYYIKSLDSKFGNPYGRIISVNLSYDNHKNHITLGDYENYKLVITCLYDNCLRVQYCSKYKQLNKDAIKDV